ncbi:metallophosphoesterase [Spirulina subsalsa]|uniref:metallophosphoesterase n=1 Tax=Spirulina subsalsa TaxID=54311 RepID=UPI0002FBC87D
MNMKRRQFLLWASVSGLGTLAIAKISRSPVQANAPLPHEANLISQIPSNPPLMRFVSVGDTGTGAQGQYAVANVMHQYYQQNAYPLVVLAGDNIYNNGEIEKIEQVFERPYAPLLQRGVKFYACLGNHDIRTDNGDPQVAYAGFNMQGRRYYNFRQGDVEFFALDTNHNADWANQMIWIEKALKQSDAPWKVVFGHHQIYSSGHYGINQASWVKSLTGLFKTYGVQLYINGHDHHYERIRPVNGTTYMICGGGAGLRPIVNRIPQSAYAAERLSFAAYTVYPHQILIQGIGTDGNVFDQGIINRQA